jgi:hypothetical protein
MASNRVLGGVILYTKGDPYGTTPFAPVPEEKEESAQTAGTSTNLPSSSPPLEPTTAGLFLARMGKYLSDFPSGLGSSFLISVYVHVPRDLASSNTPCVGGVISSIQL